MCGIAGVLDHRVSEDVIQRMVARLAHRGPDDRGTWVNAAAGVGLGHARLAIVDLSSTGHQPMVSPSGRFVITFNGEIYNHAALRGALERAGRALAWRGTSDTETLLAGFDAWGIDATVKKAVGMFAFAVWDRHCAKLTLGRDRLGEKPLYYGWLGQTFLFASELKALRAHPAFGADINRDAVAALVRYSYIPAPLSIYRGIHKLPPAALLTTDFSTPGVPAPYWSLLDTAREGMRSRFEGSDTDAIDNLQSRLSEAVSLQQMSDVPLGAFLSGGIDSSTIVALMQAQSSRPIHTFTIGFKDDQYDEAEHARAVARHLGTDHTELYVTPDETRAVVARLPTMYDEPFADSSQIPTFLVSQLARRRVTVSLSGDAGDELFGGYNRYRWSASGLPAPVRKLAAAGLTALPPSYWNRVYATVEPLLPESRHVRMPGHKAHKLAEMLDAESDCALYQRSIATWPNGGDLVLGGRDTTASDQYWSQLTGSASTADRMMALDALGYLPDDILCKVDRAAMSVSLETRVPFLDHRVVQFAWQLPERMKIRHGEGKWILRQLLYRYVPKQLVERPKMGFSVPLVSWLRGPLRAWADGLLDETVLRQQGYFNPAPIRQKWAEHLSGRRDRQYELWPVLMFQSWLAHRE